MYYFASNNYCLNQKIINELFRFSLAVSALEYDDEYRTFQDYPTYDPSYGPKFPASRSEKKSIEDFLPAAKVIKSS